MTHPHEHYEPESLAGYTPAARAHGDVTHDNDGDAPHDTAEFLSLCARYEASEDCPPAWRGLPHGQKWHVFRTTKKSLWELIAEGFTLKQATEQILSELRDHKAAAGGAYGSILMIVGLAVLEEVVKWLIKYFWNRWHPSPPPQG
jgi:hypothetical protein